MRIGVGHANRASLAPLSLTNRKPWEWSSPPTRSKLTFEVLEAVTAMASDVRIGVDGAVIRSLAVTRLAGRAKGRS
jgi:hypothetical protein